ncbi:MAG TPA: tail fiber protein [Longimicrobiales bacterium]|nr:tail fiber protein [Longimicrobiales bacterium]
MSEPFLAEIRMVGFNFAPRGWALCDGQILPISQNQSLYSLLGTTYGGDGRTSFALPDLRGRTPVHVSQDHPEGQKAGEETHTLSAAEMPTHTHGLRASSTDGDTVDTGSSSILAREVGGIYQQGASSLTALRAGTIANTGGGQAHENMMPFITLNFCIALQGLFPSRN